MLNRSLLYVDGRLLVDDDGLHGMVERCGSLDLSAAAHGIYLVGFQAGGGVGMELRYTGPDTGGKKLFVLPGVVPASASLLQKQGRPSLHVSKNSDVDHSALLHTIQTLQHSLLIQV